MYPSIRHSKRHVLVNDEKHDVIIIGAGPAGYTAAIYAARYKLKNVVIADKLGGLMLDADIIENFPGFSSINGKELMAKFKQHAESLNVKILEEQVTRIEKHGEDFEVSTTSTKFTTRSIIFATGSEHRKLGVKGEEELLGYGVSYCATCDAAFFRNRITCVVGGSDSAAKDALVLSRVAKKVYVIYRKAKIRAEPMMAEKIYSCGNIEVIHDANVAEIIGNEAGAVCKVKLDNGKEISTNAVF
nr:FAD-dependent oxidoreductase [Candidatus Sigynarchaeota archaeon]